MDLETICIFCGSNTGDDPIYRQATEALADTLVQEKLKIVYGGGDVGLMGVLANRALQKGGHVVGVIPQFLVEKEIAHPHLTEQVVVGSMHERKQVMADQSDAFIALPGGFGTLDEFFEMLTWGQLSLHQKTFGLLNMNGFFDALVQFLQRTCDDRFIRPEHHQMIQVDESPEGLLNKLRSVKIHPLPKWFNNINP